MKTLKLLTLTTSAAMLFGAHGALAESSKELSDGEIKELQEEVNNVMESELSGEIKLGEDESVVFEDIEFEINESVLEEFNYDEEALLEAYAEHAKELRNGFEFEVEEVSEPEMEEGEIGVQSIVKKGSYYEAKVWAGIPGIGHGHIIQEFRAQKKGSAIQNFRFQGNSYDRGFMLGNWSHHRNWFEPHRGSAAYDLYFRGNMDYVWRGAPATFTQTYKKNLSSRDL